MTLFWEPQTQPYGWGVLHEFPHLCRPACPLWDCLAPVPPSLLPRVTQSRLASQPFSKSATEHVQSHLSKKQVPPDLFQVGITRDREGVPATSGTRRVNPYRGLVVTGAPKGGGGTQKVWGPQGMVQGSPAGWE